jgi:KDO2-lipid IV(A) lauroyltransferase
MGLVPEPVARGVAAGVGRVMSWLGGPSLAMNERHLRRILAYECTEGVVPDPALVRRWSRRSYHAYARYWMEGARLPYATPETIVARMMVTGDGEEILRKVAAEERGIVMALPHVGSWEWGGAWLALVDLPMTAVVERLEPERLFEWFVEQRTGMGLTVVPLGEGSSAVVLRVLRDGGVVGLVSDRDLVGNGIEVEFFGERTTLPGGAPARRGLLRSGSLAHRAGAPAARHDAPRHVASRRPAADPGAGDLLRGGHPPPTRAVARLSAQLAERPGPGKPGLMTPVP